MILEEGRHGPCCPSPPCKRLNAGYKPQSVDSTDAWQRQVKNWLPFFSPETIKLAGTFPRGGRPSLFSSTGFMASSCTPGNIPSPPFGHLPPTGETLSISRTQEYPGKRSPPDPVITSGQRNRLHVEKHGGAMPAPPAQGAEERRKTCPREPVPSAKQPAQNEAPTCLRFERRCILRLQRKALPPA